MTGPNGPDEREPLRALAAVAISIAILVLIWNIKFGAASLIVAPFLAVWVLTVFLGAPLTGRVQLERLRQLRP
ncbi:MAG: hypothetical protein L0I24_18625 [Pseudonocardia sp.]|nr:hypothetical protein [Pseudonocardia sp.]